MNRKGFTLIELLVTVTLLAIIVLIAIPAVNTIIGKNKKDNCKVLKDSVIRAAELYVSDNKYTVFSSSNSVNIGKDEYGPYLNTQIKNPCDNSDYNEDISVTATNNKGKITVELEDGNLPFGCCSN